MQECRRHPTVRRGKVNQPSLSFLAVTVSQKLGGLGRGPPVTLAETNSASRTAGVWD